ncbi:MAG: response regulator transcription factor [Eubacteriales bacterium]|nr:response regulator transcription factor [Eubacteriales bacterium]
MDEILVVEDDLGLSRGLCLALKGEGRLVVPCLNLKTAREQLALGEAALVLLDVNLPDGSGLDFLRELKQADPARPVILLTANDTDMDIVAGLEQGADDYITKPFSLSVLRARVNTQLRRAAGPGRVFAADRFVFDFGRMQFTAGGAAVELSKTEQKLLRLLVEHPGVALSRGELIDRIWTDGAEYVDENALSVTVKRLRDKLGAADWIQTVYGIGYVWGKKHG